MRIDRPRASALTSTSTLLANPDEPTARSSASCRSTPERRVAVRDRINTGGIGGRRPAWLHADADRRADAGRPDRRRERRGDRHDRPRRQRRCDRRTAAEGVGGAPGRGRLLPRPGRAGPGGDRRRASGGDDVEIIPVATLDEALAALGSSAATRCRAPIAANGGGAVYACWPSRSRAQTRRRRRASRTRVPDEAGSTSRRFATSCAWWRRDGPAAGARALPRARAAGGPARPDRGELDDEAATRLLGEEAARILQAAREGGGRDQRPRRGRRRALLREATDEAQRLREEAEMEAAATRRAADAEAEL